jgi:hypothetical protein
MSPLIKLIELLLMTERTAMAVTDDTESPSAVPGFRVISAGLLSVPVLAWSSRPKMEPLTCRASRFDSFVGGRDRAVDGDSEKDVLLTASQTSRGEIIVMLHADKSTSGAPFLVRL